ncbi:NAD(P)-dependent oxidoreductase [Lacipirellula sp.]|uniref:NAD(P)-dependent oxidoreductase n=1 Tax=Lacipirellula sp. TaxID=2691419 RepID=UPI003D0FCF9B
MIIVLGATGATGRLVVAELLDRGESVRAVVRPGSKLPDALAHRERLSVTRCDLLKLSEYEFETLVAGATAIVSCLGHHMSLHGIFGPPRRLVADSLRRVCRAIQAQPQSTPVRIVLMNTAGVSNRDVGEQVSLPQRVVITLLRLFLPPHADNELAANYLRLMFPSGDAALEWVVVRPDTLHNDAESAAYELHASPTRSAIFNAGKTSRPNVARCMADLLTNAALWHEWKTKMPVIYDAAS